MDRWRWVVASQRLLHLGLVLLALCGATFLLLELLPGNLVDALLGDNAQPQDILRLEALRRRARAPGGVARLQDNPEAPWPASPTSI